MYSLLLSLSAVKTNMVRFVNTLGVSLGMKQKSTQSSALGVK